MIDTPNHSNKFNQNNESPLEKFSGEEKSWHNFLRWVIYIAFISFGGGLSYSWYFLTQKLSPLVESELTNFINRPIKLGKVESVSLSRVRFGETEIVPTNTDTDFASVKAIVVQFNPLKLLAQKKLELDLSLIEPHVYVEQDDSQIWIKTKLDRGIPEFKGIRIKLKRIHVDKTNVTLKAKSEKDNLQPDVKLKLNSSNVYFNPQLISFGTEGNLIEGGEIKIDGFYKKSQQKLSLLINGQAISAQEINNLLPLPIQLSSGKINSNLQINLNSDLRPSIKGEATLNQVNITIPNVSQPLTQTNGKIIFETSTLKLDNIQTNFALIPTQVQGLINYNNGEINLEGNSQPTDFNQVLNSLNLNKLSLPITGKIKADFQVNGTVDKPRLTAQVFTTDKAKLARIELNYTKANLELFDSNLKVKNFTLLPTIGGEVIGEGKISLDENNPQFLFDLRATHLSGQEIAKVYGQNWLKEIGQVSGKYSLFGSWKQANLFELTGKTQVEVAGGQAIISNLKRSEKNWQANLEVSGINLAKIPHSICQKIDCHNSHLTGTFAVSGNNKAIAPTTINAKGNAKLNLAGETIRFTNLELNQGNWQTLMTTEGLELAKISPRLAPLKGTINSKLNLAGNLEKLTEITAFGDGELTIPQGKIAINKLQLKESNFTTEVNSNSLELSSFSSELRGEAKGKLKVTGNLNNLNPNQVKISGNLGFSEGIGLIKQPLKTAFSWDGEKLFINEVNSEGIQAKGIINVNLESQQIDNFNLDVSAEGIDLKTLPLSLPSQLNLLTYQGKFDFNGKVFGNLEKPNILGNIALNNLAITGFDFNPLVGKIEANIKEGVKLNLAEKGKTGDVIKISLDSQYQPTEINLQVDNTTILGVTKDQIFSVSLTNLPLSKLSHPLSDSLFSSVKNLAGKMSGKFEVNLNNYNINAGEISIKNPVFANFKGDLLTTNLEYSQGKINIKEGKITKNKSNYLFEAKLDPLQKDPQFEAKLAVEKGNIQDLLESLEIFTWSDFKRGMIPPKYATAKDLFPENKLNDDSNSPQALVSAGKEDAPFGDQLNYFNEISKLMAQKKEEKLVSPIPELEELKGNYDGSVAVNGSLKEGINAEFNFEGKNWHWGSYQANLIHAKGSYQDGLLTFLPITIQQEKTLFSLLGSFNKERLSGQLRIVNLPVNEFRKVIAVPDLIDLGGILNANIAISGSKESPLAKGEISISDATINNTKIKSNQASFSYKNSRLNFFAKSILNKEFEPLTIKGSFPYQLFSNSIAPENNQFDISLKIEEDLFPLVDAVSNDEIKWLQGKGNINLDIQGNYNQEKNQLTEIETKGIATLEDAVIAAKIFPDKPLTEVNGKILFNFDRIKVENFTAKFSGGDVKLTGTLPLIENSPTPSPLTINFNKLAINLQELYEGEVKGNLNITGSAIAPKLAGDLELFNGEIFLSEEGINNASKENQSALAKTKFEDLNLILGENIKIVKAPILSVIATGNLTLNGSVNQLQPEGNIHLSQGQINLFTSQLKLAEGHKNIAKFTPENGLDPYLDIQLLASVTETNRHQFVDSPIASEIKDLSNSEVGQLQTIRVKANVKGLSSQLTEKLELTSSPQRSESEIIALLGGGFFNNFSSQGDTNLGLANLASAAFLGSFQGQLGEALGLSEFRIFPTQIINSEKRTSTLGLGAEIGLDIGSNFSVSVMKMLTNEQAPQYSIKYRLNDKALLRGASDFGKDSRGSIEFEHRF
jgi:translocation and assembly module TamB